MAYNFKILLIEDNTNDAIHLQELLAEAAIYNSYISHYELNRANRLSTGLAMLEYINANILFLDLNLPDSRGMNTLKRAKREAPGIPIIVLTNRDDEKRAIKALQFGAQDYLVKGQLNSSILARTMRNAVERERMIRDLEMARKLEQYLAYHDTLTNLPNRALFYDRLKQAIAHAKRFKKEVAVLFLDLDGFKRINDSLGHSKGDMLLQVVSQKLKTSVRESDTIARLGGDEFTVILGSIDGIQDAKYVAGKILSIISEPTSIAGNEVHISASLGICLYPSQAKDIETLVKNADHAMYGAKQSGKNKYQIYNISLDARASERLRMENSLRRAIDRREFIIHYQPQIDTITGNITGAEALVRWQHPENGLVYPNNFIPLAEETGIIVQLGKLMIKDVCTQNVKWQEQNLQPMRIAVNLSPRQFIQEGMVDFIYDILKETHMNPLYLELEITESSAMQDVDYTTETLNNLKQMGVCIAVDDFGTGYSSMGYLKRFPIDLLKIDQSFICNLPDDQENAAITRAIIALAHSMGMKVIAEGVETENQSAYLSSINCDEMQGFHFYKPLTADNMMRLMQKDASTIKF
ncbi:MAG: EAL domain-containing protein [candidate division Zixibacteria bacterium]|nr:EAL domain-containing protein [candidate division Zixibacteria bacterium]